MQAKARQGNSRRMNDRREYRAAEACARAASVLSAGALAMRMRQHAERADAAGLLSGEKANPSAVEQGRCVRLLGQFAF